MREQAPSKSDHSAQQPSRAHRFGAHLSIAGGVHNALAEAETLACDVLQVFVKNQRQWQAPPIREDVLAAWRQARAERPGFGPVVAHATYLINLAAADEKLWSQSKRAFTDELHRCDQLDVAYLVVHPGAAGEQPRPQALRRVAMALNDIFTQAPQLRAMPLLELTAGQGTALGRTFAELGEIIVQLDDPERVGVCIDTCHAFAAGYDLRTIAGYAAMTAEAHATVGLDRIRCWHLNDSKTPYDSRRDRHEHIGAGYIGDAGFRHVLRDPRFRGVPMILETPKGARTAEESWDQANLNRLRALAKGD
jgi:deoxyribonuclease-4